MYWSLGYLLGIGGATIASIDEGKKLNNKKRIFTTCLALGIIISIFLTVIQNLYLDEFLKFLGISQETFLIAKQYLRIVSMATGIYIIPFILCAFIKNDNNPNLFMIGMIVCNITNLALDYIFIFIFKLGMIGAAISTVSSQVFLILVLCIHFLRKNRKIGLQHLDIRFEDIKRIIIVGMPSFMNEITGGIIVFIFNIDFIS